jgi:hypothetical protein
MTEGGTMRRLLLLKKLLLLAALSMTATFLFAPVAMAQQQCAPGELLIGSECLTEQEWEEGSEGSAAEDVPFEEAAEFSCVEGGGTWNAATETCTPPGEQETPAAPNQYDQYGQYAKKVPKATIAVLPDTGGLPLTLVAGAMLVGAGLIIRSR